MNPRAVLFRTVNAEIRDPLLEMSAGARARYVNHVHFHFTTITIRPQRIGDVASFTRGLGYLAEGKYGTVVR
jgi:hypothetical protein